MSLDYPRDSGLKLKVPNSSEGAYIDSQLSGNWTNNFRHRSICYMPRSWNCSEYLSNEMNMNSKQLWNQASIVLYVIFSACLLSNTTTLMILTQKKYRSKLLPNTLIFVYIANLVYVGVLTFANGGIPFEDNDNFNERMYCEITYLIASFMRSVTNWTLVFVSLLHLSTIYYPHNCVNFRKNPHNCWIILAVVFFIAFASNVDIYISKNEYFQMCNFQNRKLCVFYIPNNYVVASYATPLLTTMACSGLIAYSNYHPQNHQLEAEMQSSSRVNRIIIGSTVLFALTSFPLMVYLFWLELGWDDIQCGQFFYMRALQHVTVMGLTMINFGLDSFLFIVISPPFRQDVIDIYKRMCCCCCVMRQRSRQKSMWSDLPSRQERKTISRDSTACGNSRVMAALRGSRSGHSRSFSHSGKSREMQARV